MDLAGTVAYAAALRIARFHTANEFGDWDTALHTFSFANAVHHGLRRAPSVELARGIWLNCRNMASVYGIPARRLSLRFIPSSLMEKGLRASASPD